MSGDSCAEGGAEKCSSLIFFFFSTFVVFPAGKLETVKWAFTWPLSFVLYFTVPNCNKPRWEKWFMVTFASSTLWIAAFSYMMVWMVSPGPCAVLDLFREKYSQQEGSRRRGFSPVTVSVSCRCNTLCNNQP